MEPRKFEIKDRKKAMDEQTKKKVKNAVVAGIVILGVAAGAVIGFDDIMGELQDLFSNEFTQFALVYAGAKCTVRSIAKHRENKKKKAAAELQAIFDEIDAEELGGNTDVRTKWNPNSRW